MANATDFKVKRGLVVSTTATILSTTNATSTTTGALIVSGGAGIAKDLLVAGTIYALNSSTTALSVKSNISMISPDLASTITIRMLNSDAISFSGNSGQLFSITDSMTGTIFAVNDISGVPSIEVYDTGEVRLAETFGYVRIPNATSATSTATGALRIDGGVGIGGNLYAGGIISATTFIGNLTGTANTSTNLAGGATGSIPYQTAPGITSFIGIGSSAQLFQSNGTTATWVSPSSLVVGIATTATTIQGGTAGQLHYQSAPNVTSFLSTGTTGQLLVSAAGAPVFTNTASIYVGNSTKIDTIAQTANASYFPTFVDANNASAAGEIVYTTSSFVINPSTGNVGIGSASPGNKLTVAGNIELTSENSILFPSASIVKGGSALTFNIGSYYLRATQTGQVTTNGVLGVNTSTPESSFQVVGDARISGITTITNATAASSTITGALQVVGGIGVGGGGVFGGTVTATNFVGSFNGTVSTASSITTVAQTANATYFPAFVDANNASATAESLYTTSSFIINPGTGNVGIGTASPGARLEVLGNGDPTINTTALKVGLANHNPNTSTQQYGVYVDQRGGRYAPQTGIFVNVNNPNGVFGGPYYGIDTFVTSSSQAYQRAYGVSGTAENTSANYGTQAYGVKGLGLSSTGTGATIVANGQGAWGGHFTAYGNGNSVGVYADAYLGSSPISGATAIPLMVASNGVERMRVDAAGNVGIGITSPASKLHVSGDARITGITTVSNTTAASSTITGALQVAGGVGIGGNSYIGGSEFITGTLQVNSTNANTTTNTSNAFYTAGGAWIDKTLVVGGDTTFKGSVVFQGTNTFVYSSSTVYTDNLISLHAPSGSTPGNHTWTVDDGKDIGFMFHYYKGADKDAFLGFANDTQYLEWYSEGTESGGVFTGTTYGTFKTGGIRLVGGASNSGNTTTGDLQVLGGVGIGGGLFVGGTVTATTFVGTVNGAATQVNTVAQTANASYFPTFVDTNNASATAESVYTTSSFAINPSTGNVGIGTSSPSTKLQVEGSIRVATDGSGANYLQFQRNTSNNWKLTSDGVGDIILFNGNSITMLQDTIVQRGGLTVSPTLASAQNAINITQTWNTTATVFTLLNGNVTDTASSATSLLMDLQVGGASRAKISKVGEMTLTSNYNGNVITLAATDRSVQFGTNMAADGFGIRGSLELTKDNGVMRFYNNNGTILYGIIGADDGATNTLAQRNGANAQTFRVYNTYTNSSNYERLSISAGATSTIIKQENAGTGALKDLIIDGGGNTKAVKLFSGSNGKVILETSGNQTIEILPDASHLSVYRKTAPGTTLTAIMDLSANSAGGFSFKTKADSGTSHTNRIESNGSYTKRFEITAAAQSGGQYGTDVFLSSGVPGTNTLRAGNIYIYAPESGGSGAAGNIILQNDGATSLSGNVGIGTTSTASKLHVAGDARITGITTVSNTTTVSSTITGAFQVAGGVGIGGGLFVGGTVTATTFVGTINGSATQVNTIQQTSSATYYLTFVDANNASSAAESVYTTSSFTINPSTRNVGINTATPTSRLHITESDYTKTVLSLTNEHGEYSFGSYHNVAGMTFQKSTGTTRLVLNSTDNSDTSIVFSGAGNRGEFRAGGDYNWYLDPTSVYGSGHIYLNSVSTGNVYISTTAGKVGIGTAAPASKMHVAGDARITGITTVSNTTAVSSTITGAFQVAGGVGIGGSVFVGGTVTATTFVGTVNGSATQVNTVAQTANASYYLTFVDANNASSTAETVHTTSSFVINPSTGNVGIGNASPTFKVDSSLGTVNNNTTNYGYNIFADASGNVGYSGYNLQLNNSTANATGFIRLARTASTTYLGMEIQSQSRDGIRFLTSSTTAVEVARIDANGNVGIGTSTPAQVLDVKGWGRFGKAGNDAGIEFESGYGKIYRATASGNIIIDPQVNSVFLNGNVGIATTSPASKLHVAGDARITGITTVTNTTVATSTITGAFQVVGGAGIGGALFVGGQVNITAGIASTNTATGSLVIQGGVGINGALNAITKSFNIGHPTKPGMSLRYGSLEGPEFGVYVRGRLKGSNTIELPEYWSKLVNPDSITVNLTPIGSHQKLYVEEVVGAERIVVGNENLFGKTVDCYYTVYAERADIDPLVVEG